MGKILVLYASTTGNTEIMADVIADTFEADGYHVDMKTFDFDWIEVEELLDYDAILIGTHTWDDGSLPYEVEDFYDDLEEVVITNLPFAVFGSADSFYPTYGGAVDLVADRVVELGGQLYPERLKVDMHPDKKDIQNCQAFSRGFEMMLQENEQHDKTTR